MSRARYPLILAALLAACAQAPVVPVDASREARIERLDDSARVMRQSGAGEAAKRSQDEADRLRAQRPTGVLNWLVDAVIEGWLGRR